MKVFDKVSCVVDTHKDERVSQFYTRLGDADRKARQMNQYQKDHRYLAKELEPWPAVGT